MKNTIRLYRRVSLLKTSKKNCKNKKQTNKEKNRGEYSVHTRYDVIAEFKTLQLYKFVKSDQHVTKLCARPCIHKTNKIVPLKKG